MNINFPYFTFLTCAALLTGSPAQAAHAAPAQQPGHERAEVGRLVRLTEKDAAWASQERKSYPLSVCPASGEELGSMGQPPAYKYQVSGKPDRLVIFCCRGCEGDFMKDPVKHLAKIDSARTSRDAGKGGSARKE